tara:strand:+ start:448 stop:645 length:198 start_codon:yes stop_codon:yes gene_type:complete
MNVSDYNTVKTVLKRAEIKAESRDRGIIDIAKRRGFIDKNGKVTPEGQRFLHARIIKSSLSVSDT